MCRIIHIFVKLYKNKRRLIVAVFRRVFPNKQKLKPVSFMLLVFYSRGARGIEFG